MFTLKFHFPIFGGYRISAIANLVREPVAETFLSLWLANDTLGWLRWRRYGPLVTFVSLRTRGVGVAGQPLEGARLAHHDDSAPRARVHASSRDRLLSQVADGVQRTQNCTCAKSRTQ